MSGPLYLAWRYLVRHRWKTVVLVGSIALIAFLPAGLDSIVEQSATELTARAAETPLLVGARGSPLELALSALYFDARPPEALPWSEVERVSASGLASGPVRSRMPTYTGRVSVAPATHAFFRGIQRSRLGGELGSPG